MASPSPDHPPQVADRQAGRRVAVIGASGYGGLQTLRLLQDHPSLSVTYLGGERSSGKRWSEIVPFLPLPGDPIVQSPNAAAIAEVADLALLSLPNGLASGLVPALLEMGVKVVDLSADYRYRSLAQWQEVYSSEARAFPRSDAELCREAVYGLVEWESERIAAARLVAAPGCFPTASLLATVYGRLRDPGLTAEDCTTVLEAAYRQAPCVSVLPVGTYPSTKWVRQTNRALISVQVDQRTGQLVVMSAIDNLIKGQAGQGVQCLNLLAGLPATTGLPLLPFYP